MSAAERTLDFHPPPGGDDILEAEPSKSAPHLASILQNVTVDKALDSIARILEVLSFTVIVLRLTVKAYSALTLWMDPEFSAVDRR